MSGVCKLLPWDSEHFGLKIGRVCVNKLTPAVCAEIGVWIEANSPDCLYFLAAPEAETLRLAAESGFRFVDTRITLECRLPELRFEPPEIIRPARAEDLEELRRIASESHHDSRFYLDGNFPREACGELYRIWITKGFESETGAVFVLVQHHKPAGYISVDLSEGEGVISLLAVDQLYRGHGYGAKLVRHAMQWFKSQGLRCATVPTQAGNIQALRLYERCGFLISKVEPWFHWWAKA